MNAPDTPTTMPSHIEQAYAQYDSIKAMLHAYDAAVADADALAQDEAHTLILESPFSVEVRSDWLPVSHGQDFTPGEYRILLCTGGPACQIVGDLDDGCPATAELHAQGWGTPWTRVREGVDQDVLIRYAGFFLGGY